MTRFDATTPADRRALYRDGIVAHRERTGGVLTLEVDVVSLGEDGPDPELGAPWIQYEAGAAQIEGADWSDGGGGDDLVALDCTDAELDRLKDLLGEYPAFTIDDLCRPEDVDGTNVRIRSRADADRLATFFEDVFRRVFGLPEDGRVGVTSI